MRAFGPAYRPIRVLSSVASCGKPTIIANSPRRGKGEAARTGGRTDQQSLAGGHCRQPRQLAGMIEGLPKLIGQPTERLIGAGRRPLLAARAADIDGSHTV